MDVQCCIMYWEWKDGRSILTTSQLYQALDFANEYWKDDIYWLLQEIAKRDVSGECSYSHY